jgi:hypothetical protein
VREIGGFFELELAKKQEFHKKALKLNTGRNALEYILKANDYQKIYLPYYVCNTVMEPVEKLGVSFECYHIDKNLFPQLDLSKLGQNEVLLYVNYFGICSEQARELVQQKKQLGFNLCLDYTQAFFAEQFPGVDTFYSARKFFGVPEGGYLYTNTFLAKVPERERGSDKFAHLIGRIESGAQTVYADFRKSAASLRNQPIRQMSKISERILASIDYEQVRKIRRDNFNYIHENLKEKNTLTIDLSEVEVPMVYPLLFPEAHLLRDYLISKQIYVAQYWPEVLLKPGINALEHELAQNLAAIPIDQRYNRQDMAYISTCIAEFLANQ